VNTLELKIHPDQCLRIKTKPVERFDDELESTIRAMADTMYLNQGIGLAATQVGLGLDLMITDIGEGLTVFMNPEIVEYSPKKDKMEEGCLSLPGVTVNVARSEKIKVRAQDIHGEASLKTFDGLMAKVIQHEIDHLNGKLLIDYLNPVFRLFADRKLSRQKNRLKKPNLRI